MLLEKNITYNNMGNFWSDKVPHHLKKKSTPESRKANYEFWKNLKSKSIEGHKREYNPNAKTEELRIVKAKPLSKKWSNSQSKKHEEMMRQYEEFKRSAIKNSLDKHK